MTYSPGVDNALRGAPRNRRPMAVAELLQEEAPPGASREQVSSLSCHSALLFL